MCPEKSLINRFRRFGLQKHHQPNVNQTDIRDEIYKHLSSLNFNQVDFDDFKKSYEKRIIAKYPLFGELCKRKAAGLPSSYASHEEFMAYWRPFNLMTVLSSIEEEQAELPENLECVWGDHSKQSQMTYHHKYVEVTFEFRKARSPGFFRNSIISLSCDKKDKKHSFATLGIARVLELKRFEKPCPKSGKKKKFWRITAEMQSKDYQTARSYAVFYVDIVCSYYIQNLHQENLDKMATNEGFLDQFLKPKVSTIAPLIDRNYRTDGKELNEFQDRAVQTVLKCMANPSEMNIPLIIGPPGTGKSHTIVTILENVFQQKANARVLVCAPSNAAANVLARRVVDNKLIFSNHLAAFTEPGPIFRLGAIDKVDKKLRRFRPKKIKPRFGKTVNQAWSMLEDPCLIFSTLNSCQPSCLRKSKRKFDLVIIDEAAQSTEIETLMAFAYGCNTVVLVGDPKQLPPTVKSQLCSNAGYSRSFFERYQTLKDKSKDKSTVKLLVQYRMKQSICDFPSNYFYDQKLRTFPTSGVNEKLDIFSPITCFDLINSAEEVKNKSRINILEAKMIVEIISKIISKFPAKTNSEKTCEENSEKATENSSEEFSDEISEESSDTSSETYSEDLYDDAAEEEEENYQPSIGVICFYKAQAELIHEMLKKAGLLKGNDIKVNTVDSFQGQEKDIILISCCRANKNHAIGFCHSEARLNVALTRAKSLCCVIVNKATFEHNPMWASLFSFYDKQNRLFEDSRTSIELA